MATLYGELEPVGGGDPIPLLKERLLIGRREKCDIVLNFSNVSGEHCELILSEGYWYIRDLNSSNGTKVAGQRVTEKRIDPGTVLGIAKNEYQILYNPSANGAIGPPPPETLNRNFLNQSLMERAGLQKRDLRKVQDHKESSIEDIAYDIVNDAPRTRNRNR